MSEKYQHLSFKLKGKAPTPEMLRDLGEITVDQAMGVPDMCMIHLHDDDWKYVGSDTFAIGTTLEVVAGQDGKGPVLFKGEIVALEADFTSDGHVSLIMQAYDKSHRLHRGRRSRTFLQQPDREIIKKMASEAQLGLEMTDTGVTHTFMLQSNQTNMEWLLMRAEQLDYQVYVDTEDKLHFKPAGTSRGSAPKLVWGDNLIEFRPRLSAAHQVDKITLYAWDELKKEQIKSEVTPDTKLKVANLQENGSQIAKSKFSAANSAIVNLPVSSVKAAEAIAQGAINALGSEFARAEGRCWGDENIVVGGDVDIVLLDTDQADKYNGKYRVTSLRHVYRSTGVWETFFTISGREHESINALLADDDADNGHIPRIAGVVPALVTNVNDKDKKLGRVKVKFPWLWDADKSIEIETDWIRVATPSAGANRGIYFMPEVNDEVLVAFEHGDPRRPYVIGALWNNVDKPPLPSDKVQQNGMITKRMIRSRSGHVIVLDDTNGSEQIVVRDKSEKNEIVIDTSKNSITVKCQKDITLDAGGDVNIKAGGKVNIESTSNTEIKSNAAFNAKGQTGVKIEGAKIEGKAQGQMKLESSGIASLKGATTKINGDAAVIVQGGIIKLN